MQKASNQTLKSMEKTFQALKGELMFRFCPGFHSEVTNNYKPDLKAS